jgi:hypothetical protein
MNQEQLFDEWQARVEKCGATLSDVRTIAKVHPANFSNWRNGKAGMTLASVQKIEGAVAQLERRATAA